MHLNPQIKILHEKKLIGLNIEISFSNNLTYDLWQSFMKRKKEIKNVFSQDLFSMQIYPENFDFNPTVKFIKWAAVEVIQISKIPEGMDSFIFSGGLYAVFHYKGSSEDISIFKTIFNEWLPKSKYIVDNRRPHFEVLGQKYKNNNLNSEEDIYIPIKLRTK